MFGSYFYHQRIKKSVAVFGSLFNNIYVARTGADNTHVSQEKVPLSYAPKRKFIERLRENPDLDNDTKIAVKLPRMSFEMITVAYDPTRQLQKTNTFSRPSNTSPSFRNKFYTGVPYNISFQLNIYSKTHDDALQVVEQIVPFFSPQYTLTVKPFKEFPDVKEDVPITLNNVTFTDDYEGALEARRTIIYTLDFEMKVTFYSGIEDVGVIRKAIVELYNMHGGLYDSDILLETITVEPDPLDAETKNDVVGYTTNIIPALDSA